MSALDFTVLDLVNQEAKDKFTKDHLRLFNSYEDMLADIGYTSSFLKAVSNLSSQPTEEEIFKIGEEWFPYEDLNRYSSTAHYPRRFAEEKLKMTLPVLPEDIIETNGVFYHMTDAQKQILILRPDEVLLQPNRLIDMLGEANDGRFNVLEVLGMYHLIGFELIPKKFMDDVWRKCINISGDGMDLRSNLKNYSISIKRWPGYWSHNYKVSPEYIMETEAVLGYIISEFTETHKQSIRDTLSPAIVRFVGTADEFFYLLDTFFEQYWVDKGNTKVRDVDFNAYLTNWNLWTTSGSAPEFRIKTKDKGKKLRINKSTLPLVTTKKYFTDPPLPTLANKAILKSEIGKARIAYSVPTYFIMREGYISYKYYDFMEGANSRMFTSMTQADKFITSADFLTTLLMLASSDIEKNDFIHSTYLDTYFMIKMVKAVLISQEDIDTMVTISQFNMENRVFVPNADSSDYEGYYFGEKKAKGVYLKGSGGVMSGRRWTTIINGFINCFFNYVGETIVNRFAAVVYANIFGGDDSMQYVSSLKSGIFQYITISASHLTINPTKSYISYQSGEFFRVLYLKKKYRSGYWTRIIHSIVANNPVSRQEIDIISKLKAFWSNCQQILRRTRHVGIDYLWSQCVTLAEISNISESWLSIPVSSGGVGVSRTPYYSSFVLKPGIPRFREPADPVAYEIDYTWFDECMLVLDPFKLDNVPNSYRIDMMAGIRDYNARREARKKYYTKVRSYQPSVYEVKRPYKEYDPFLFPLASGIKQSALMLVEASKNEAKTIGRQFFRVASGRYQEYSDILNRARFPKFGDKIRFLVDNGISFISQSFINRHSGYVTQQLLTSSVPRTSSPQSLPADMNFMLKTKSLYECAGLSIRAPDELQALGDAISFTNFRYLDINAGWALPW